MALDGFHFLFRDIKTDWKIFTQEFSKIFDSERNKQLKTFHATKIVDSLKKRLNNFQ